MVQRSKKLTIQSVSPYNLSYAAPQHKWAESAFIGVAGRLILINKEIKMHNLAEQFIATNKANLQTLEGLTSPAFASVEKLVELNMAASKVALEESFSHINALLGAKDVQELLSLQSDMVKPLTDRFSAHVQQVQSIASASGAEFTKAVEVKTAEVQKAFSDAVDNLAKTAPAGTESTVAAFMNALTTGQAAVESAQTSAKKALEVAQSTFATAASQAVDAVNKITNVA